jgi:hypothetical protein
MDSNRPWFEGCARALRAKIRSQRIVHSALSTRSGRRSYSLYLQAWTMCCGFKGQASQPDPVKSVRYAGVRPESCVLSKRVRGPPPKPGRAGVTESCVRIGNDGFEA